MSQDIKLVAFDLDGTVIPMMGTTLSSSFVSSMERAAAKGVVFAVFTGRSITTIPTGAVQHPAIRYLCHSNGGGIVDKQDDKVLYSSPMPNELALEVLETLLPMQDMVIQIFSQGRIVYLRHTLDNIELYNLPPHHVESIRRGMAMVVDSLTDFARDRSNIVDKLNVTRAEGEQRQLIIDSLSHLDNLDIVSSGGVNLEFNARTTNKGLALEYLTAQLGLVPAQVMAIGDNNNDIGMLQYAGVGVALGSGSQAARDAADYVTLPLEQEGAAYAIDKFIP